MFYNLYSAFDESSEHFGPIMMCRTDSEARRAFESAVKTPGTPMHDFPKDFKLYLIGTFDDEDGAVDDCDRQLHLIASGFDFVKEVSDNE